jgi:hypothetical protein
MSQRVPPLTPPPSPLISQDVQIATVLQSGSEPEPHSQVMRVFAHAESADGTSSGHTSLPVGSKGVLGPLPGRPLAEVPLKPPLLLLKSPKFPHAVAIAAAIASMAPHDRALSCMSLLR